VTLNIVIPQLLWVPVVRRSEILLFLLSLGIIVGMWLERFDIVVPNLARNWMPSYWGVYYPTLWDWATLAGSIGLFLTIFFLLLRVLPIVSIAEVREMIAKDGSQ
jgi:molybdopterin-containing oxidoreductase family membrane subunit